MNHEDFVAGGVEEGKELVIDGGAESFVIAFGFSLIRRVADDDEISELVGDRLLVGFVERLGGDIEKVEGLGDGKEIEGVDLSWIFIVGEEIGIGESEAAGALVGEIFPDRELDLGRFIGGVALEDILVEDKVGGAGELGIGESAGNNFVVAGENVEEDFFGGVNIFGLNFEAVERGEAPEHIVPEFF